MIARFHFDGPQGRGYRSQFWQTAHQAVVRPPIMAF